MKIIFFTFYYPPDLSAGSFRSVALIKALLKKIDVKDELHVITTHPNRYSSYKVPANDIDIDAQVSVHRILLPTHQNGMLSQARAFAVYAFSAYKLCKNLKPDFLIGTSSRLMTGLLTGFSAHQMQCRYFIDLRDIFSETISDLFAQKNKTLGGIFKLVFSFLEKKMFKNASGVNVVSEGFFEYFQSKGIDTSSWTFFPNGIDCEFTNLTSNQDKSTNKIKTVLYAGNIGNGQGLETILPNVAKQLGGDYQFLVIGDGSSKNILKDEIKQKNISNVKVLTPVNRVKLIEYYHKADILFLHLNNIPAFQRVLPSKIFEYAALEKPIVAGLSGYSAEFLKSHVPYATVFQPGNADECVSFIKKAMHVKKDREKIDSFKKEYTREVIMKKLASHILTLV